MSGWEICRPSGSLAGLLGLLVRDDAVGLHFAEDKIAAAQRLLRIEQRRIGHGAFGQAGEQSRLGQIEVLGVLAEVELARRPRSRTCRCRDRSDCRRE